MVAILRWSSALIRHGTPDFIDVSEPRAASAPWLDCCSPLRQPPTTRRRSFGCTGPVALFRPRLCLRRFGEGHMGQHLSVATRLSEFPADLALLTTAGGSAAADTAPAVQGTGRTARPWRALYGPVPATIMPTSKTGLDMFRDTAQRNRHAPLV